MIADGLLAALKPGGRALIVATAPEGDEWRLVNDLIPCNAIYPRIKECLDSQGIRYEETPQLIILGCCDFGFIGHGVLDHHKVEP